MTVMAIITSILIILLTLYLIVAPFFNHKQNSVISYLPEEDEKLDKKQLYATLNEIELDYHMDKLSKEDYAKLKNYYETLVAKLIKAEQKDLPEISEKVIKNDRSESSLLNEIEAEIEDDLRKLREERGSD